MNDNITTIVVGLVSAGAGLLTVKLKGTNSNEKIYAAHTKELSETVEKLLKERQDWQDERIELKTELAQLHYQIEQLTLEVKRLNGEIQ